MKPTTALVPKPSFWRLLVQQKAWFWMAVPWALYCIVFNYLPLWGWLMAFQDFRPAKDFWSQEWVGLQWFEMLFTRPGFWLAMRNTLVMSLLNLVLGFVTAIGLALLLSEVRNRGFKRTVQTLSYLPYFVSWVVAANIVFYVLSLEGPLNSLLVWLGIQKDPMIYLAKGELFWPILAISNIWKNVGWNAIIYLAAIATINPELYEAADMDGASRFQKIRYITLPAIRSTFVLLLVLSLGHLLSAGFDQPYLLMNPTVKEYAVNLDVYVFTEGLMSFGGKPNFSYGTAAGIFKAVVSLVLIWGSNKILKANGGKGLF